MPDRPGNNNNSNYINNMGQIGKTVSEVSSLVPDYIVVVIIRSEPTTDDRNCYRPIIRGWNPLMKL